MAKILIVDDSSIERFILKKCLIRYGHDIAGEATNSGEALQLYKATQPDIVILDIVMPDDNGIEILKQIMQHDNNAKVIMCTSAAIKNTVIEAAMLGAKHFLVKPVTNDDLLEIVDKVLNASDA